MNRRNIHLLISTVLFLALFPFRAIAAQNIPSVNVPDKISAAHAATPPMPKDPAEILALGAKTNGLNSPEIQPWHIKLNYEIFDKDGSKKEAGSYEEFWVSAKKYKRSYASSTFTQTDFATEHGLYRLGNQNWPGFLEEMVRSILIEPIPSTIQIHDTKLRKSDQSFGSLRLQCIILEPKNALPVHVTDYPDSSRFVHYCLGQKEPVLRFYSQGTGAFDTLYNDIVLFQGHYLARDVQVTDEGKPLLALHLETLETLANVADLSPPSDAIGPITGKVKIDMAILQKFFVKRVFPQYPGNARLNHIQGEVVVKFTVGKNGQVISTGALSGPEILREAATSCVKQWKFRPFLVEGEPVEVECTTKVMFMLGGM